nr:uncharacterized protein LOC113822907 [Penaeus vannamei]
MVKRLRLPDKGAGRFYLFYSGSNGQTTNELGIISSVGMKENVISVSKSGRIMRVKLFLEETVNIVSAYVPQVGCEEEEEEVFWRDWRAELEEVEAGERVITGGDLNEHIGINRAHAMGIAGDGLAFATHAQKQTRGTTVYDIKVGIERANLTSSYVDGNT